MTWPEGSERVRERVTGIEPALSTWGLGHVSRSQLPYCMANGLARLPGQVGPEIISSVLAPSGTIAGLLSRLGAMKFRVWSPRALLMLRAGFVNGMSYQ